MIVLERQKSMKLLVLEALMRRLPENDKNYEYYKKLYMLANKGYEGELLVDREWIEIDVPTPYFILHNLELVNEVGNSHQMDTLFLSPNFVFLIEIKDITGRIDFEPGKHQLIRTNLDGTYESFRNPLDQLERHVNFLGRILTHWNIKVPIESAVVIARNSTIIGNSPPENAILHASGLQAKIHSLFHKYPKQRITRSQIKHLKMQLLNKHIPQLWNPQLSNEILRKGVLCRECEYQVVKSFKYGQFTCSICGDNSEQMLIEALLDFRILHSEWITNKEVREYLGIQSRHAAKRIIKKFSYKHVGSNKGRKYLIPELIE